MSSPSVSFLPSESVQNIPLIGPALAILLPALDAHVGVLTLRLLDDSRDGDRGSVDPGHKEPLEDGPVEPRVGPSGEESVEL